VRGRLARSPPRDKSARAGRPYQVGPTGFDGRPTVGRRRPGWRRGSRSDRQVEQRTARQDATGRWCAERGGSRRLRCRRRLQHRAADGSCLLHLAETGRCHAGGKSGERTGGDHAQDGDVHVLIMDERGDELQHNRTKAAASPGNGRAGVSEWVLDIDDIQPLVELQPGGMWCSDRPEANAGAHADRADLRGIADHRDHPAQAWVGRDLDQLCHPFLAYSPAAAGRHPGAGDEVPYREGRPGQPTKALAARLDRRPGTNAPALALAITILTCVVRCCRRQCHRLAVGLRCRSRGRRSAVTCPVGRAEGLRIS